MPIAVSKHRLRSNAFTRPDEEIKVDPKRVIFLSVEGDNTETDYFKHLNEHLDNSIMQIEVLRHKQGDGYSDPEYVIDLLSEYVNIRENGCIPVDLPEEIALKYSREILQAYLDNSESLSASQRKCIKDDLLLIGIDLDYRRYLEHFQKNSNDVFAVILDRDCGNHSRELMEKCVSKCSLNHYNCYITNPCFEFWLLLHLRDVRKEYTDDQLEELRQNTRISKRHTTTSKEVSCIAGHSKSIPFNKFEQHYYPNIHAALAHSKQFVDSYPDLYDQLGTNLPQLFEILGFSAK